MAIINLRDFCYWYAQDEYMEVSDDMVKALRASARYDAPMRSEPGYDKAY